jgi:hypothetical protein
MININSTRNFLKAKLKWQEISGEKDPLGFLGAEKLENNLQVYSRIPKAGKMQLELEF